MMVNQSEMRPHEIIRLNRVTLKTRNFDQAEDLFQLIDQSREHLKPWMPWEESTKTVEDTRNYLKTAIDWWQKRTTFDFSIYENSSQKIIGSFGLHSIDWPNRSCALGYWLGAEAVGHGYITEIALAIEELVLGLSLHRVVITCDSKNTRSQLVAKRLDYRFESLEIDEARNGNEYRDTLQFVKLLNPPITGRMTTNLPAGFSIEIMDEARFNETVGDLKKDIFNNQNICLWPKEVMSPSEEEKLTTLNRGYVVNYALHLVLFYKNQLAGWTSGFQNSRESYCMANSVILPEFRGRSLYSNLLEVALEILTEKGFQRIVSHHHMTNNSVLIPKLKRGFVITGTQLSDRSGALVELTYFTNHTRKKVLRFRSGAIRPDKEISQLLRLSNKG